jgi:tetratricopeptide (TPR) repeat protein
MATETLLTNPADLSESVNARRNILQNFLLVWLDTNIDVSNDDFRNSVTNLRRIVNHINIFTKPQKCIDFLSQITEEKAFMIISGSLDQQILTEIHAMSQVDSIYVFCSNKPDHEQWTKDWPKVKGVFTEIGPICVLLKETADQSDSDCLSVSILSTEQVSQKNLDELDQSFMYTQILKEILFEINYDAKSFNDFITFCRDQFRNNSVELEIITKFEKEYNSENALWWYTYECFLYRMLNRVLRTQEIGTLIKIGFFIRDLHQQLEILHLQQYGQQPAQSFTLYRGQSLSVVDFEKLLKTPGGLLSFNNFLSTSADSKASLEFGKGGQIKPGFVSILFEITVNTAISSAPYALLDEVSFYKDAEKEILFSAHTVFRIGEIKPMDDEKLRWLVKLTLTSNNNSQLDALTQRLREETAGSTGWHRLGILLIKVAEYDKAERVYKELLTQNNSNDAEKADIYHQLGWVKRKQGDYVEALSYYEKALDIWLKAFNPNHPTLFNAHNNIGSVYFLLGQYSKALSCYEKALEVCQTSRSEGHPDFGTCYNSIGLVYYNMGQYAKALSYYEQDLEISKKILSPNHIDLAASYNSIGLVRYNLGEYSQALSNYEKALDIFEKALPPNHPDLIALYKNIGNVNKSVADYLKALSYYEMALEICLASLPENHPNLATSYNNIGLVKFCIGEYLTALSYYKTALKIRDKALPLNHPDFATSYDSIGDVYNSMGNYSKALSYYEKAFEIYEKSLPPYHPNSAVYYNNIGTVYYNIREYPKALSSHKKALEIRQKALPPNHPDLATSYNNIGNVYKSIGDYTRALFFHERAVETAQQSLSEAHPDLQAYKTNTDDVRKLSMIAPQVKKPDAKILKDRISNSCMIL